MPFGLDLMSMIVGAILALFVFPMVMSMIGNLTAPQRPIGN